MISFTSQAVFLYVSSVWGRCQSQMSKAYFEKHPLDMRLLPLTNACEGAGPGRCWSVTRRC